MVTPNSSNERPYVRMPTNSQPPRNRNPMYWSIYGDDDDQAPVVPPKDPDYNPVFPTPVMDFPSSGTYTRQRHTSLSAYEPQSAPVDFPEPQRSRLISQRSFLGIRSLSRHRKSKSETGANASTTSLPKPESRRDSYSARVSTPVNHPEHPLTSSD